MVWCCCLLLACRTCDCANDSDTPQALPRALFRIEPSSSELPLALRNTMLLVLDADALNDSASSTVRELCTALVCCSAHAISRAPA